MSQDHYEAFLAGQYRNITEVLTAALAGDEYSLSDAEPYFSVTTSNIPEKKIFNEEMIINALRITRYAFWKNNRKYLGGEFELV